MWRRPPEQSDCTRVVLKWCVRVRLQIRGCVLVQSTDVLVKEPNLNAPLTPPAKLHSRKVAAPHQRVGLSSADVEMLRHLIESQKAPVHTPNNANEG